MTIKWTVKDCIEHLQQLKNPFEKAATLQKPKLSDALNQMVRGNGGKEALEREQRL